jgi:ABC-type dipeptide/oligopeptide/nickel transport system permease subunit
MIARTNLLVLLHNHQQTNRVVSAVIQVSEASLRIAKPLLLVSTPIGVVWGVVEAYRFRPVLALLMSILIGVISAFMWLTVRTIRREQRDQKTSNQSNNQS